MNKGEAGVYLFVGIICSLAILLVAISPGAPDNESVNYSSNNSRNLGTDVVICPNVKCPLHDPSYTFYGMRSFSVSYRSATTKHYYCPSCGTEWDVRDGSPTY